MLLEFKKEKYARVIWFDCFLVALRLAVFAGRVNLLSSTSTNSVGSPTSISSMTRQLTGLCLPESFVFSHQFQDSRPRCQPTYTRFKFYFILSPLVVTFPRFTLNNYFIHYLYNKLTINVFLNNSCLILKTPDAMLDLQWWILNDLDEQILALGKWFRIW